MLQVADIFPARTRDDYVTLLLAALRGVGHVTREASGGGWITLSGVAEKAYSIRLRINTAGDVGVATFDVSMDGGETWDGGQYPTTDPIAIGDSGVTVTFEDSMWTGPTGEVSFHLDDTYGFETTVPTFPVASWQSGSTPRTFVELDAEGLADVSATLAAIAAGGYVSTARGAWLTLLAREVYGLERKPAVQCQRQVELSDAAGQGPFSISPGDFTVASGELRFTNVDGGTLTLNGTLTLTVAAESPGSAYNLPGGSLVRFAVGALPGVTITDPGTITQQGVDLETDESLRGRCRRRWAELAVGGTEDAYRNWALAASDQVTRVGVLAGGAGTVTLTLAGPAGAVTQDVIDAVDAALASKVILGMMLGVQSAVANDIDIVGTVRVRAASQATATAAIDAALRDLEMNTPVGGERGFAFVSRERIIAAIAGAAGVLDLTLTTPAADVALAYNEVPAFTITLTMVAV